MKGKENCYMNSLKGKVALITGVAAKRGMGHGVALRLVGEGANVVVVDKYAVPRTLFPGDEGWGGLNAVVAEVESLGSKGLAVVADISNSQEVDAGVAKAIEKFGRIDILVHCAAIRGPMTTPLIKLSEREWKTVLDVNLNGAFFISTAVAKNMVARGEGGKIVLISSLAGNRGVPGSGAYCVSKWGVIGLVKTLALELATYKINVNALNPGTFGTHLRDENYVQLAQAEGITLNEFRERYDKQMTTKVPLGRMGTPEDIANLVLFLVSDQSSYITGQAVDICGGWGLIHG
jgi:meso-butanediol dehydrogenase/(S,S)-butanediol dehydrogenase/diacetyl reductase